MRGQIKRQQAQQNNRKQRSSALRPSQARIPSGALHIHHSEAFMEDAFLFECKSVHFP
jgi:hypothetical protein